MTATTAWAPESIVTRETSIDAVRSIIRDIDVPNAVIHGSHLRDDIISWACESCSPDTYPTTYATLTADIVAEWSATIEAARS